MDNPTIAGQTVSLKTALVLIDIQQFYYPPSPKALVNPEQASANAALVLKRFRESEQLVVHIKHNVKAGSDIYPDVAPMPDEKVIIKNYINSFRETGLQEYLQEKGIKRLILCGMMTHMCVEAATRAAADLGYKCIVLSDACATRDLVFGDKTIPAELVHYAVLSTITYAYGKVMTTGQFLDDFRFRH